MSLINNIRNFCMKHKRIVCLLIFILLAIFLSKLNGSMKEGITLNTCSLFNSNQLVDKNCANCLAVTLPSNAGADGNKCYWNADTKLCGSFLGAGFKDTCTNTGTATGTGTGTGTATGTGTGTGTGTATGTASSTLKLLDTPTWFKKPDSDKLALVDTPTWFSTPSAGTTSGTSRA